MQAPHPMSLDDRLRQASAAWCSANKAKPGRLGRLAINDGGFFTRLENNPGASTTTATLTRFAEFLADPANWPDGVVADEAKALAHVVGVSPQDAALSAGKVAAISRGEKAA
ncbi:MAG: hypothetical protein CMI67_26045 [Pelagibaca sp.]|nr:hypothetical protein [Pelagibaca sp.]